MLSLKFRVSCDHIDCEESIEIEVDWSDVSLDLNSKKINIPNYRIYGAGWEVDAYYGYTSDETQYFCSKHKKAP